MACSQIDSVKSVIIGGDTLHCLNQEQAQTLLEGFALCDSYQDSLEVHKLTIQRGDSLRKADQAYIDNLERDLELANLMLGEKDNQLTALNGINTICEADRKRQKRQKWIAGFSGLGVGILTGILIGVLVK